MPSFPLIFRVRTLAVVAGAALACGNLAAAPQFLRDLPAYRYHQVQTGSTQALAVVAQGKGKLTYQWYKGGKALDGQVGPSLVLLEVAEADGGEYWVAVTDADDQVTLMSASALIVPQAAPKARPEAPRNDERKEAPAPKASER